MPRKAFITLALLPLLVGMSSCPISAQLYINELMSSNGNTIQDEDGDCPDWVEIYNAGDEPVNLLGYGLSDRPNNPFKWRFPEWTIAPEEYLIVFASDKNRTTGPYLHTSWAIRAEGEEVVIAAPDGTILDRSDALPIPRDVSYGRKPDGGPDWFFFNEPTPGAPNTTEGYQDKLDKPLFSHAAGFYTDEFEISLSHPDSAVTIRYTTDGSLPGPQSDVYSGPIPVTTRVGEPNTISIIPTNPAEAPDEWRWRPPVGEVQKATIIRAIAEKNGKQPSNVATQTFFVHPAGADRYSLPVWSICTDPSNLFDFDLGIYVPGKVYAENPDWTTTWSTGNYQMRGDDWERPISIEFFENDGELALSMDGGVRIHGGGTRALPQKSLRLYARADYGTSWMEYPFFESQSITQYKRLILRNSGNDWLMTLFRDAMIQSLVESEDLDTQAYRPSIVFINGEYWGIHNIRERQDKYYLATHHGVDPDAIDLLEGNAEVSEGSADSFLALRGFITAQDLRIQDNYQQVVDQIDIDSFITYNLVQLFAGNVDWPANNVAYWRPQTPEGKWRWLLYDLDYSFGYANADTDLSLAINTAVGSTRYPNQDWATVLLRFLLQNREFRNRFLARAGDLTSWHFVTQRVIERIDAMQAVLAPEIPEHQARWQFPAETFPWDFRVTLLRRFAKSRPASFRQQFVEFFGLGGLADVNVDVNNPAGGSIQVNSLNLAVPHLPWTGTYFRDVPIQITAIPSEGFTFTGWEGDYITDSPSFTLDLQGDISVKAIFQQEEQL